MTKLYIYLVGFLIGLVSWGPALAQVHPGNNLYTQNMFSQNAAFASSGEILRTTLQSTKMLGQQGNDFSVSRFTVQGKLKNSFGVGSRVLLYNQGSFSSLQADLVSSYQVHFTEQQSLQAGVSFGIARNSAYLSGVTFNEFASKEDPLLIGSGESFVDPLIGLGFNYFFKNLQVAFSLPSVASGKESFFDQYQGIASYSFDSVQNLPLQIKPLIALAKLPYSKPYADFNIQLSWDNTFWVQPGYRTSGNIMTSVGLRLGEFDFGYGFGVPCGNYSLFNRSLHEVILSFRLL